MRAEFKDLVDLALVDGGNVSVVFGGAVEAIAKDIANRPALEKKRTVTLTVTL